MPRKIWAADEQLELSHVVQYAPIALHLHPEAIVAVVVNGSESLWSGGHLEVAERGSVVVIDPECPHRNAPLTGHGVQYRGFYLDAALLPPRTASRSAVLHDPRLAAELVDLHQSLERTDGVANADVKSFVAEIFSRLPPPARDNSVPDDVLAAAATLRTRCADRIRLRDLALSLGVSEGHLTRRFRNALGIPPHLYQVQFRIARAKRMIRGGAELSTVALECGFTDQSHFSHQFRRYVGATPGAFARDQDSTIRSSCVQVS